MAVGLEGAHTQLLSQGEGLQVVGFGLLGIGGDGVGLDDAKLVQRDGLVGTLFVLPDQGERLVGVERIEGLNGDESEDVSADPAAAETPDPA